MSNAAETAPWDVWPSGGFPDVRMRRLRSHPRLRDLVRETVVTPHDFILPLFVRAGRATRVPIAS
ncbi:MAG TPA: hypothetical protein EYP14_07940, partial [Planctomycetaceae bacterium]|nr:hypothetical protein [Planctomycetaceae bacterium]